MAVETKKIRGNIKTSIIGQDISQGEGLSDDALTFPNLLTIFRILLTPAIVALLLAERIELAFYLFAFAACTDFIDGWYAKNFGVQTRFGAFLDPLADKILTISVYLWLGLAELVPNWIVVLIISREVFILLGMLITWIAFGKLWVAPLAIGKLTTFAQLSLVGLVLMNSLFGVVMGIDINLLVYWGIYVVSVLTLLSVLIYVLQWFMRITRGDKQNEDREPSK